VKLRRFQPVSLYKFGFWLLLFVYCKRLYREYIHHVQGDNFITEACVTGPERIISRQGHSHLPIKNITSFHLLSVVRITETFFVKSQMCSKVMTFRLRYSFHFLHTNLTLRNLQPLFDFRLQTTSKVYMDWLLISTQHCYDRLAGNRKGRN
jgi:hypothetical protein